MLLATELAIFFVRAIVGADNYFAIEELEK
jgi:hypothetical protein